MRSSERQLRRLERSSRTAAIVGGGTVITAACWALWTLGSAPTAVSPIAPTAVDERTAATPIAGAFGITLWPERPAAVVTESTLASSPPAPPPLDVQLLGIAEDLDAKGDRILRAALYERSTGRVLLVTDGEVVQGRVVSEVTPSSVRLTLAGDSQTLTLKPGGRP